MAYKAKYDDNGQVYIHYSWESFKQQARFTTEAASSNVAKARISEMQKNYSNYAKIIKTRNLQMLGGIDSKKGEEAISDIQQFYHGLQNIMNPNAIQDVKNMVMSLKNDIRIDDLMWMGKTVNESAEQLDIALKKIEDAIKCYNELDASLVKYIESSNKKLQGFKKVSNPNQLTMFSLDKKAQTSYTNLLRNLEIANSILAFNGGGSGPVESIEYKDSDKKIKTKQASSLIYGMRQRLVNMLGGTGEIVGAGVFHKAIQNDLIPFLQNMNNVSVKLTGDEYRYSMSLDKMVTRTSDFTINFDRDGAQVEVGFSVKAQILNKLKSKSVTTTYLTSPYDAILKRANLLGSDLDYALANGLAHNQYAAVYGIRKLIASIVGLEAIGGRSNDPVVFLMYLDEITTSHEFLEDLAKSTSLKGFLDLSFDKSGRDAPHKENSKMSTTAYARSKKVLSLIYKLKGQIQYEH